MGHAEGAALEPAGRVGACRTGTALDSEEGDYLWAPPVVVVQVGEELAQHPGVLVGQVEVPAAVVAVGAPCRPAPGRRFRGWYVRERKRRRGALDTNKLPWWRAGRDGKLPAAMGWGEEVVRLVSHTGRSPCEAWGCT